MKNSNKNKLTIIVTSCLMFVIMLTGVKSPLYVDVITPANKICRMSGSVILSDMF